MVYCITPDNLDSGLYRLKDLGSAHSIFEFFPTVVSPAGSSAVTITGINFSSIRDLECAFIAVITTVEKVFYYDDSTMISKAPPMSDVTKVLLEFAADGINFFDFGARLLYTPSIILKDISPRAGLFDETE